MAMRWSDKYNIVKDQVGTKVIKKTFKDLTEWWVYREKKHERFTDLKGERYKTGEVYLYCIIVCSDEYIRAENEQYIAVEGVKMSEEDLDIYLSKTGRK